jgi:hypothetical protein
MNLFFSPVSLQPLLEEAPGWPLLPVAAVHIHTPHPGSNGLARIPTGIGIRGYEPDPYC